MCGIFALIPSNAQMSDWIQILPRAILAVSDRGRDSIGITIHYGGDESYTYKCRGDGDKFLDFFKKELYDHFFSKKRPLCILGVARAQPLQEVLPLHNTDNPPFSHKRWTIVHNGIISNDVELQREYQLNDLSSKNDTMTLLRFLTKEGDFRLKHGRALIPKLQGAAAFLLLDRVREMLYFYRDFKPLYFAKNRENDILFISTETMASFAMMRTNFNLVCTEIPMYSLSRFSLKMFRSYGNVDASMIRTSNIKTGKVHYMAKRDERRVLAVCSGGLDSTTTLAYMIDLGYNVTLLHFNYGQKAAPAEIWAIYNISKHYKIPYILHDITWLRDLGGSALTDPKIPIPFGINSCETDKCWTPARNLVMLSIAAAYADRYGYARVVFGANLQENSSPFPDNESTFADKLDAAFRLGTLNDVRLEAPLSHKMKEDIVRLGHDLKVPFEMTWSCDQSLMKDGNFVYCGECGCCYSSAIAFVKAGIEDPRRKRYLKLGDDIINDLKRYKVTLND